jgi:NTP pyrophosphatase (non-canonical NTP hydrolase)
MTDDTPRIAQLPDREALIDLLETAKILLNSCEENYVKHQTSYFREYGLPPSLQASQSIIRRAEAALAPGNAGASEINHFEHAKDGVIDWKMEAIRANRLHAQAEREIARLKGNAGAVEAFQPRVLPWMLECFGLTIPFDKAERNHRFLEEALELVQACGCTQDESHQLVDYVYGRDQGDINQEVGGVMVTLAALCIANGFDMHGAGETELARIWTKVEQIRAKQAAKPKHSPLPAAPLPATQGDGE